MNSPSDSLHLDEHLARVLAAFDQHTDGADGKAQTIGMGQARPLPGERAVTPMAGGAAHEGSLGELLPGPEDPPAPPQGPPSGVHRVGRFELRRQLGKGGCGIVFLAYDPKLEREVALKIPRPEMLLSPDARRRLVREALAAAEFDHPNLVPVYESGEIGPVCFIATAFCPGQTLGEWLDRQMYPVPVRQAARLVGTLAEAVQHAHDRGVLHRDLKPNNVILQATKDDPEEQEPPPGSCPLRGEHFVPRVVDFGLAKLLERGGPSETATRQILGTPKYMAPEQAQARHEDVGPAADVYALGVILYELVTGRPPYEGNTDVEVLRLAIEGDPTRPRHLRADVPRDLEAICLKAMDRYPARRYRNAIDLADDLRRFLDGRPTLARPLRWPGRAARWLRRNDQAVAIGVVTTIAGVLLALGWWSVGQTRQLKSDQQAALLRQAERTRADQQREYADAVRNGFLAWRAGDARAAAELVDTARRLARTGGDPTDFPLEYLAALVAADRPAIVCPAGAVTALAVSADGRRLASGHADGSLAVWDRATGRQLGRAPGGGPEVRGLAFALGDTRLISADGDRAVGWAVSGDGGLARAGRPADDLRRGVTCLAVSPDGRTVYAGGRDGEAFRIDPADPAAARPLPLAPGDRVTAVAVSPGGKCVLFGTDGGKVVWCDAALGRTAGRDLKRLPPVSAIAPPGDDGDGAVIGLSTGGTYAPGPAGDEPDPFPRSLSCVHWVVHTRCGAASSWADGTVRFGAAGGGLLVTGDAGPVRAGAVSRDGAALFTAGPDGVIRGWDLPADVRRIGAWAVPDARSVGVHPDGTRHAVGGWDRVTDYAGTDREATVRAAGTRGWAWTVVRVPRDGPAVAAYPDGDGVAVREVRDGSVAARFAPPDGAAAVSADLTPDATRLAVGDDRGRVGVWDVPGRALLSTVETGHPGPVRRVVISADGGTVAALTEDGVGVWSAGGGRQVGGVGAEDGAVFALSPAGDRLVTAGRSGVVRVWGAAGEEHALRGHVGRVTAVGVSPDGRTVVSGGAAGEVKFWDVRTGRELVGVRRHAGPVAAVGFAANGRTLVTAGAQVAVWDAPGE